jgi:hypothetical protein
VPPAFAAAFLALFLAERPVALATFFVLAATLAPFLVAVDFALLCLLALLEADFFAAALRPVELLALGALLSIEDAPRCMVDAADRITSAPLFIAVLPVSLADLLALLAGALCCTA